MSKFKLTQIQTKSILSKSNLPVADYSVNPCKLFFTKK
ncbi:hypothetical protein HCMG_01256 [Helicobacter canadensis MIT 98-5491]|nr:hypothetical protein HCMG_01256 [Helicobacter canadensis MIT 98-5491]